MIIGAVLINKSIFHGPNADTETKKVYIGDEGCYKFEIEPVNCKK